MAAPRSERLADARRSRERVVTLHVVMKRPGREIKSIRPGGRAALEENPREIIRAPKRLQNRPVLAKQIGEVPLSLRTVGEFEPELMGAQRLHSTNLTQRHAHHYIIED